MKLFPIYRQNIFYNKKFATLLTGAGGFAGGMAGSSVGSYPKQTYGSNIPGAPPSKKRYYHSVTYIIFLLIW